MDHEPHPALLPAGLRDTLPPQAGSEVLRVEQIMAIFAAHAYQRVDAPLLEFEEGFARGSGIAVAEQSFRVMDPGSHRMMVLRADMTPQVARIAAMRLVGAPRPLRLCYAGQCIRVAAAPPSTDRQVCQTGIELIGPDCTAADAEIMRVAVEALASVGLTRLSLDLTLPTLVPMLLDAAALPVATRRILSHALDRKDAAAVALHGGAAAPLLTSLLMAAGPAAPALVALRIAALPEPGRALVGRLEQVVAMLAGTMPGLRLTIDPVELRGFRYYTGLALTVFAAGRHEELGRGGRYLSAEGEPATGITLYADAVLRAAPAHPERRMIYLPAGTPQDVAAAQRQAGFATLAGLGKVADDGAEARRLGCGFVLRHGQPDALPPDAAGIDGA